MTPIHIYELRPNPCVHGTHDHMSDQLRCLEANGNPGFTVIEEQP